MRRIGRLGPGALLAALCLGLAAPAARAQVVVAPGDTLTVPPDVANGVSLGDGSTLLVQAGGSVASFGDTVIDTVDGTTITVSNLGTITSLGFTGTGFAINAGGSTLFLTNSGTIFANTHVINATTITSLVNSGTMTTGNGGGRVVGATTITSLVNSGTITSGGSYAISAQTITSLINSGIITGNFGSGVRAVTITSLINSGTIRGHNGSAGILMDFGTVVNSGLIEAGTGIEVDRDTAGDASITNSGIIRSLSGPGGIAIDFQDVGLDTLTVLGDFTIEGAVRWDGVGDTLNFGPGRSSALSITDLDSGAATLPTAFPINTAGQPFVVTTAAASGAGSDATTTVHVVDPTGFALADAMLADTTGAISDVLADKFGGSTNGAVAVAMGNGTSLTVTPVADTGRVSRAWAEAFGGWKDRDADGPSVGSEHVFGGVVAGIDTTVGDDTRVGLFVGGAENRVDVDFNAQDIDTESVFGGLYASHETGGVRIDGAVTVGLADYDSKRYVANNLAPGGIETAKGDYDGVFVSPELTVSTDMAMGAMTMRPSLRLRYAGLWLDDYTETGSASNLTVDDRSVHILEARAQLAVPMTMMEDERGKLTTELRVGVDGRTSLGSDNVDAVLVGQAISFDPGGEDDVVTGFAAAAFAMAFANNVSLTGSIEAGYGTDDTAHANARLGARVDF